MTVTVKICGVRTPDILDAAVNAGADFVGLVFFAPSPRNLTVEKARALTALAGGRAQTVAVMVDPDDGLIETVVMDVRPDALQLHGDESPERVAEIKARTGLPVLKAVPVSETSDVAAAARYAGVADQMLFDAKAPEGAALPGGNGIAFDWQILRAAEPPFALSGGLAAANVSEAIRLSGATMVDVSSGVEVAPGIKDVDRITDFVRAARGAAPQHKKAS